MAQRNVEGWSDFDRWLDEYIPKLTLDKYRVLSDRFETLKGLYVSKTPPRKVLFTARIQGAFRELRSTGDFQTYKIMRQELESVTPYYPRGAFVPGPPHAPPPVYQYRPPAAPPVPSYQPAMARPMYAHHTQGSSSAGPTNRPVYQLLDWRASPMWKPVKALSAVEHLPDITEKEGNNTRRLKRVSFTLPPDVLEKLSRPSSQKPRHSIRLFCTSAEHYRPQYSYGQPPTTRSIPIEYPSQPEVLYDDAPVIFKDKGLRGRAGTAPPLDVATSRKGINLLPGRLTTVQFAHMGPTLKKQSGPAKRFYFQIVLTEITTKDELFAQLKTRTPRAASVTVDALKAKMADEDDIVIGSSKMSLKDSLSYMRLNTPIRSSKCPHVQCFDAFWWLESNVATPQWLCPLCSKELDFGDLFVDGYTVDILAQCPDSVDEVTIEPDGEWHTDDNKYGSAKWLASAPKPVIAKSQPPSRSSMPPPTNDSSSPATDKGKGKAVVILSSDGEDDDLDVPLANGRTNGRETSASVNYAAPSRASANQEVIDLTFDSDDDDDNDQPLAAASAMNGVNAEPPNKGHGALGTEALKKLELDMERASAQMALKRKESSLSEDSFDPSKRQRHDYGMGYR